MSEANTILAATDQIKNLPSPPQVALQILEITQNPDKGMCDLAEVLRMDAALTAKILQIANSSAYARSRQIETVSDAVNLLGSKSVSLLALGFSLKQQIPGSNLDELSNEMIWKHSIATAVVSRSIARAANLGDHEVYFLCGLLSRIGQLIFASLLSEQYRSVLAYSNSQLPSASEEREILGTSHHDLSARLLAEWKLPALIVEGVANWGGTTKDQSVSSAAETIVNVLKFANEVRGVLFEEVKSTHLKDAYELGAEHWCLTEEEVDGLFSACQLELNETIAIFVNQADFKLSCVEILEMARLQMIQSSVDLVSDLSQKEYQCESLQQTNKELEFQSTTDKLTGLRNRAALEKHFAQLDNMQETHQRVPYSVVMLDIDKFKSINDTFGHAYGDEVLKQVGQALAHATRATDFVARYGGEEFTVVLKNCLADDALAAAERFRKAIRDRRIELPDGSRIVTASAGVASTINGLHGDVIERADNALYQAKNNGRNQTVQYRDENNERASQLD